MQQTQSVLDRFDSHVSGAYFDQIRKTYSTLHESQFWPAEKLQEWQLTRVSELVRQAVQHVPFYRQCFGAASIASWDEFRGLPLTTRSDYASAGLSETLAGTVPPHSKPLYMMRTSGTTGVPISIADTLWLRSWRAACILREFEWHGVDPRWSCAVVRTPVSRDSNGWDESLGAQIAPSWFADELELLVGMGPGYLFDITQPLERIADSIKNLQPEVLHGTPSMLESLIELLPDFRPKALLTISEQLFPPVRGKLEIAYGAPVIDTFGTVEINRGATDCPDGGCYHVHDENVIMEVLNDDGKEAEPGKVGKLYVTALHNLATPLIRYELGDLAERPTTPCACGRGLSAVSVFHGRQVSRVALPNDRFRVATGLVIKLLGMQDCKAFQLLQTDYTEFSMLYVAEKELPQAARDEVSRLVSDLICTTPTVRFERAARIEPLPNGKTPPVLVSNDLKQRSTVV